MYRSSHSSRFYHPHNIGKEACAVMVIKDALRLDWRLWVSLRFPMYTDKDFNVQTFSQTFGDVCSQQF
jgi:hypothetical protein